MRESALTHAERGMRENALGADRVKAGRQWPKSNQFTFTKSADWPLLKVR